MKVPKIKVYIRPRLADGSMPYLEPVYTRGRLKAGHGIRKFADGSGKREIRVHFRGAPYYLRIGNEFTKIGPNPAVVHAAILRKEAELAAIAQGVIEAPIKTHAGEALASVIQKFLSECIRKKKSAATMRAYTRALKEFQAGAKAKTVNEIGREQILDFAARLDERGVSVRTRNNMVEYVRTFLLSNGQSWPLKRDDLDRPTRKKPTVYAEEQLSMLLSAATPDERDLILFLLQTGCREKEAQYAMYSDLAGSKWLVKEKPQYPGFRIKDSEEREMPASASLISILTARRARHPGNHLVFPTENGRPDGHLLRRLKNLALRAGVNCGLCRTMVSIRRGKGKEVGCKDAPCCSEWTLHRFRRTYASRLHAAGIPILRIKEYLGHADIQTTMAYLGLIVDEREQEVIDSAFASLSALPVPPASPQVASDQS